MKTLILAEKPSVASEFANVLAAYRKSGFYENESYIVTNAIGHLLELKSPEDYDPSLKKWSLSTLPIIPHKFQLKANISTREQLNTVVSLLKREDVYRLILATDAGREGELIGREVLFWAGFSKPVFRFWSSEALTPEVIKKGLSAVKPLSATDYLYNQGASRSRSDWLVGMNISRALSVKMGSTFTFGRVQTAVLALIVDRERDYTSFISKPYFLVKSTFSTDQGSFSGYHYDGHDVIQHSTEQSAKTFIDSLEGASVPIVSSIESKLITKKPPKLYDLTSLQIEMNRKHGLSATETLDLCQELYEKYKCLSYPRTPSRVLGKSSVDLAKSLVPKLGEAYKVVANIDTSLISEENSNVFNDSQLEDHHALIPLNVLPEGLSEKHSLVFKEVLYSFVRVFMDSYTYDSVQVILDFQTVTNGLFLSRGIKVHSTGWTSIYDKAVIEQESDDLENNTFPPLVEGENVSLQKTELIQKKTKPKPRFTEATILKVMQHPNTYLLDDTPSFESGTGLGTPATRDAILSSLIDRKYICRKNKALIPEEKGFHLIDSVRETPALSTFIRVDETAKWENNLKENPIRFVNETASFVAQVINDLKGMNLSVYDDRKPVCKCPCCTGEIFSGKDNFYCSDYKNGCKFSIPHIFLGQRISDKTILQLTTGGKTRVLKFTKKDGKSFEAALSLNKDGSIAFHFPSKG